MHNFLLKVLNFLKKLNTPLTYAITSALFGVALLCLPSGALSVLFILCGTILTFFGVVGLVVVANDSDRSIFRRIGIVKYGLLTAVGVSLAITRTYISPPLCHALGLGIAVWSAVHIYILYHTREPRDVKYYIDTILTSALAIFGVLLLITPTYLYILTGVALLLLSAKLIFDMCIARANTNKGTEAKDDGIYYVDDFVDKSDE